MEPEPNSDDEQNVAPEQSFFEEAAELEAIVKRVVDSEGKDAPTIYDRYKTIVSRRSLGDPLKARDWG